MQPRKDGLGTPPFLGFFLLLHVTTAPEYFEHKHRTFNAPTFGDIGSRVGDAQFWGYFGNPILGRNPPRNPLPSQEGRFLAGFLGRKPPLPIPLRGQEPPFLDPSYDPSYPEAIAHKAVRWGLNCIVPPH